jgi:hypothetical protein
MDKIDDIITPGDGSFHILARKGFAGPPGESHAFFPVLLPLAGTDKGDNLVFICQCPADCTADRTPCPGN